MRQRPVDAAALERAARRYLETRFTSRAWLKQLLMRRVDQSIAVHGGDRRMLEEAADQVLDRLEAAGSLDDAAYARGKARSLVRRGVSAPVMRARLAGKGLGEGDVREALSAVAEEAGGDPSWAAACAYVRRRRFGAYRGEGRRDARGRDLAAMARAGFSFALAARALDASVEDLEESLLA